MRFYRGPWVWDSSNPLDSYWRPPAGCAASIDLRSLPEQAIAGGTPGLGVFVAGGTLPSEYDLLGSGAHRDVKASARLVSLMPTKKGYTPKGDDLLGLIFDVLTDGSDPDGLDFAKPLMPTIEGRFELHCGQSHYERFQWKNAGKVKQLLRKEFASLMQDAQDGKLKDRFHHLRILDFWCEKYGLNGAEDWKEFVPNALQKDVPGRLRHETTITDNFTRADADGLGSSSEGWSWTETSGDLDIVSNKCAHVGTNDSCGRAESDLSSSDHYAQAVIDGTNTPGVLARYAAAAQTFYMWRRLDASNMQWYKRVAGTLTQIGSNASDSTALGHTIKAECNGSSMTGYVSAVSRFTATDTSISSNTRGGLRGNGVVNYTFDDFEAADLGGGGGGIIYTMLERGPRGYVRGVWKGGL